MTHLNRVIRKEKYYIKLLLSNIHNFAQSIIKINITKLLYIHFVSLGMIACHLKIKYYLQYKNMKNINY